MKTAKQIYRVKTTLTIVDVNYIAAEDILDAYRQAEELLRLSGGDLVNNQIDKGGLNFDNELIDEWQLLDAINAVPLRITENISTQTLKDELKRRRKLKARD
jgi:hypothetical protein